jgi:hypothetical protein
MTVIRISDIPQDELHLLPVVGLWQQIEDDRNRTAPTEQRNRGTNRPDKLPDTLLRAAEPMSVPDAGFVTDWQLEPEAAPSSRLPVDSVDADADKDCDDEDFADEDFDEGKDDDADEDGDNRRHTGGRLASGL